MRDVRKVRGLQDARGASDGAPTAQHLITTQKQVTAGGHNQRAQALCRVLRGDYQVPFDLQDKY